MYIWCKFSILGLCVHVCMYVYVCYELILVGLFFDED